jgi:hypothetical protein
MVPKLSSGRSDPAENAVQHRWKAIFYAGDDSLGGRPEASYSAGY